MRRGLVSSPHYWRLGIESVSSLCFVLLALLCMTVVADDAPTTVVFETELGDIVLEIDSARAPKTAAYFLSFVERGDYNGSSFYRAASLDDSDQRQIIQGGILHHALNRSGALGINDFDVPSLKDFDTTKDSGLRHQFATVSMARDLLKTGDVIPEFVICFRDTPTMDYGVRNQPDERGFPAFGRVIAGIDVARKISDRDLGGLTQIEFLKGQVLSTPVRINRAYKRVSDSR